MSKTLTFAQILSSPVLRLPSFLVEVVSGLFLLRWSFLSSFLKRLSKSWQLTKIFQTQLRKSPKTTTKTTMSTSLVHSGAAMARRWRGDGVAAAQAEFDSLDSFLTSNTRGSESPLSASNKRSSRKLRKEELHHAASGFTSLRLPPMFSKKAWELRQKSPMWKMAPLCAAASVVQKRVHNHTILKALEGLSCSKM